MAVATGIKRGFAPLRSGRWIWAAAGAFLALDVRRGRIRSPPLRRVPVADARSDGGEVRRVRAARAGSPARPAAARRPSRAPLVASSLWSCVATIVGLAQFLGASIFVSGRIGGRQGSFLSEADFAALSGAVLLVGIVALLDAGARARAGARLHGPGLERPRRCDPRRRESRHCSGWRRQRIVLAAILLRRRQLTCGARAPRVVGGSSRSPASLALRGSDLGSFARFVGTSPQQSAGEGEDGADVRAPDLAVVDRLPDLEGPPAARGRLRGLRRARRASCRTSPRPTGASPTCRPPPSLPPPTPYGVQDVWVQALADLGVSGSSLLITMFATVVAGSAEGRAIGSCERRRSSASPGRPSLVWLWTAQSFVAGIPLDALTWLAFGLVAAERLPARKHA